MRPLWLAGLALSVACTATSPAPPNSEPSKATTPSKTKAASPIDAATTAEAAPKRAAGPVPAASTQLIVSRSDGWKGTDAVLQRFERDPGSAWRPIGDPIASTLGRTGLGWGRGLHSAVSESDPVKHEGDGRSPAGVFRITSSYGYDDAPKNTKLPFQQVSRSWRCVNDSQSKHYNKVLDSKGMDIDWSEAEKMRRRDHLYELVIEVDHNHIQRDVATPTPGDGSCIFLHVWRRPGAPTIGCTAMPLEDMQALLAWLSPEAAPVLIALPAKRYDALRTEWDLPTIETTR